MPLGGNAYDVSAASGGLISSPMCMEIQRRTGALPLSSIIQRRRLSLLGHIICIRMPESSDVRSLLVARVPVEWKRPRGRPKSSWLRTVRADLDTRDVSLEEAIAISVDRSMWREKINEVACSSCYAPDAGVGCERRRRIDFRTKFSHNSQQTNL